MSFKKVASNVEWQARGKHDPLFAVATWPGKEKGGTAPWTDEEFYEVGRRDWESYHARWQGYGLRHEACLEIGCGAGRITRQLARDFEVVHGVDVSADMIAYARCHVSGEQVHFHLTDGASIPLGDESVSAVFSCYVFQHFETLEVARGNFREIYRVLEAGGTIMIHLLVHRWPRPVPFHQALHSLWGGLARSRLSLNRMLLKAGLYRPFSRSLSYPVDWLCRELGQIGFQRVEIVLISLGSTGESLPFVFATKE